MFRADGSRPSLKARRCDDSVIRIGILTPHAAGGPEEEFAVMAPAQVASRVVRVSGDPPTTPSQLRAFAGSALNQAARTFAVEPVEVIGYASTSTAYALGFDAEAAMLSRLTALVGVPVASTCSSAVRALRLLDVERIALIEPPWFGAELVEMGEAYFQEQGFDVVSSQRAELSQDPGRIEPADVIESTLRSVQDDAQAIFIGGNGFRAARAIDALERRSGRPVVTSNQVLLWSLLGCVDAQFEVVGYGRLFAQRRPVA
jgi:maleate isomerase